MDTTQTYGVDPSFTITLAASHASYRYMTSIQSMDIDFTGTNDFRISAYGCAFTATTITNCVVTPYMSSVHELKFRYIVLKSTSGKLSHFYRNNYFLTLADGTTTVTTGSPIVKTYAVPAISLTGTVRLFVFCNGLNATASSSANTFKISFTATYLTSTSFELTISNLDASPVDIKTAQFAIIGINSVVSETTLPLPTLKVLNYQVGLNSSYSDSLNTGFVQNYNTFWGMNRF